MLGLLDDLRRLGRQRRAREKGAEGLNEVAGQATEASRRGVSPRCRRDDPGKTSTATLSRCSPTSTPRTRRSSIAATARGRFPRSTDSCTASLRPSIAARVRPIWSRRRHVTRSALGDGALSSAAAAQRIAASISPGEQQRHGVIDGRLARSRARSVLRRRKVAAGAVRHGGKAHRHLTAPGRFEFSASSASICSKRVLPQDCNSSLSRYRPGVRLGVPRCRTSSTSRKASRSRSRASRAEFALLPAVATKCLPDGRALDAIERSAPRGEARRPPSWRRPSGIASRSRRRRWTRLERLHLRRRSSATAHASVFFSSRTLPGQACARRMRQRRPPTSCEIAAAQIGKEGRRRGPADPRAARAAAGPARRRRRGGSRGPRGSCRRRPRLAGRGGWRR